MKIIVDKIDEYPRHALSKADVRLILASMPAAWTEHVKVVRLSSSQSAASVALLALPAETLTIASRGRTRESALHMVLAELAAHASGFKRRTFQRLQSRHQAEVNRLVAPLMDKLLPQLSRRMSAVRLDQANPAAEPPAETIGPASERAVCAS
jgi:outer membrane lipopolysaccharide assembly protein LptE/RlpB